MIKDKTMRNRLFTIAPVLLAACLMMVLITACDPLENSGYFGPEGQGEALIRSERDGLQTISDIP